MSDEYIRRDTALRAVTKRYGACRSPAQNRLLDEIRNEIMRIPRTYMMPVIHAKWTQIVGKQSRICSFCERDEPYKFAPDDAMIYNFCPYCGAKMDGGAEK